MLEPLPTMTARRRRAAPPGLRARVPARSRVTVRRMDAPLLRSTTLGAALRESRAALGQIEGELESLLAALRDPAARVDAAAADRLRGATVAAGDALASLRALARR